MLGGLGTLPRVLGRWDGCHFGSYEAGNERPVMLPLLLKAHQEHLLCPSAARFNEDAVVNLTHSMCST